MTSVLRPLFTSALLAVAATGCVTGTSRPTPPLAVSANPTAAANPVAVEIAAVTLADECDEAAAAAQEPAARSVSAGRMRRDGVMPTPSRARRRCEQTSMQLSLKANTAAPSAVHIKKVELLGEAGAKVAELKPREPKQWATDGTYKPWDENVASDQPLSVSYSLSAPDWEQVQGGRYQVFRLRVTMTVGTEERTLEKEAVSAALTIEPPVMT